MRVMYIAPRFHTNQRDIIKGWLEHGDEVCFVSHYKGKTEDYTDIKPIVIGYSKAFLIFYHLYVDIFFRKKPDAPNIKLKCGFPPIGKMRNILRKFKPDVVIIRERSVYSMCSYASCKHYHIKTILYNQSPVWGDKIKNDIPHKIVNALLPKYRMTPVLGKKTIEGVCDKNAVYIPFVMYPQYSPEERKLSNKEDDTIEIFEVGKYETRKNHRMLLEVIQELKKDFSLHLSIAGECSNHFHQEYFQELEKYIKENDLGDVVTLHTNLKKEQMEERYREADLFVIPSTKEPASISQLEAMAFSLPIICSNKNGTAYYVENGVNGFWFEDNNIMSLREEIKKLLDDNEQMRQMGCNSYKLITEKYQFDKYYEGIMKILQNEH